jgi:hypothetical protein
MKKKRKGFVFGMLVLFLGLILIESSVSNASDCYQLFYNWDCIALKNFDTSEIVLEWETVLISKHKDGSIKIGPHGDYFGAWSIWGTSFGIESWQDFPIDNSGTLNKDDRCHPLFTGYKTMYGFMVCRNGVTANKPPGCFLMMKLKPKDCPWIAEK